MKTPKYVFTKQNALDLRARLIQHRDEARREGNTVLYITLSWTIAWMHVTIKEIFEHDNQNSNLTT